MIRHVVSWKLAEPDAALRGEQAAEVARRLNALMGVVPELRAVSAGAPQTSITARLSAVGRSSGSTAAMERPNRMA